MHPTCPISHPWPQRGSALLASSLSLFVLSAIAGTALLSISGKLATPHRSIAWNEALAVAEAGIDCAVADLTGLLPDVRLSTQEGLALGAPTIPPNLITALGIGSQGVNLSQGVTLSYEAATLTHGGEGAGRASAMLMLDVLPLSTLLGGQPLSLGGLLGTLSNPTTLLGGGPDLRLVRLRSRGTVWLAGPRRADVEKLDAKLRRPTLVWDRESRLRAGAPNISREVEVLLRPVLPFQNAVATTGGFSAPSAQALFDSFNSLTPLTSTGSRYDPAKRLSHGDLSIGGSHAILAGTVRGDVRTGGANLQPGPNISGTVDNAHSERLPVLRTPTWSPNTLVPTHITGTTSAAAGSNLVPTRIKTGNLSGTLRITRGLLNLGTHVEIWITGDITGGIEIPDGVQAKIYVEGQVRMNVGRLVNGSGQAANLQIYGIGDDPASGARGFELGIGELAAAIYVPTHHVTFTGDGHFSGAVAGASFTANDAVKIHYDEALGLNVGPVLRYAIASYVERRF
jgi:hypothetical protein